MAEYALRLTNGTDTAPRVRMGDALPLYPGSDALAGRNGLRPGGGGEVTVVTSTMTVQVTPFSGWIDATSSSLQGGYPFVCDATKTLTITDGDAALPRTDTIVAVVREDAFDASGATEAALEVVVGTPGAGAPALPPSCIALRDVVVPAGLSAGTGGLQASHIGADRREYTLALGGVMPVSGVTERDALAALYPGMTVYRQDTDRLQVWNGAGWDTFTPELDTGWITAGFGDGNTTGGSTFLAGAGCAVRVHNGVTHLVIEATAQNTNTYGSNTGAISDQHVAIVPAGFEPTRNVHGIGSIDNTMAQYVVRPDGYVMLAALVPDSAAANFTIDTGDVAACTFVYLEG